MVEYSIILPAHNEENSLVVLLPRLKKLYPEYEIIIVNDGSYDDTETVVNSMDIKLVSLPYRMGNGAAIKAGARAASGQHYIFMDADGQHLPEEIENIVRKLDEGFDMVVGSRSNIDHSSLPRLVANKLYNWFAGWVIGHKIDDLTSGFRIIKADLFNEFINLLPNGFSYPTTITMAMFRAGYKVAYVPITLAERVGTSHLNPLVDGIRFLIIIFKVGTLYAPLKFFAPVSALFFMSGFGYYLYTFFTQGRFTNMGVLLLITSVLVFLIGLISEQLTVLLYTHSRNMKD